MITSIVVNGTHSIAMNNSRKILVDGNTLSVDNDIPFIRYRFDGYGDNEVQYIDRMIKQFNKSTHLVEIEANESTHSTLELLNTSFTNIAKFLYVTVTDHDVDNEALRQEVVNIIADAVSFGIDRVLFRDKTTKLDLVSVKRFIKQCRQSVKKSEDFFGVCQSPLSFSDRGSLACLNAVRAREIMSMYSPVADAALPTANHQCMNCCGCIRYIVVKADITEVPSDSRSSGGKKSNKESKPRVKSAKSSLVVGATRL